MGGYSGEIAEFTRIHQQVEEKNAEIHGELGRLRSNIEGTQAAWQGQAAAAFRNLMMRFDEEANNLNQALTGIGELLANAGSQYEAQEIQESEQMSNIAGRLNPA